MIYPTTFQKLTFKLSNLLDNILHLPGDVILFWRVGKLLLEPVKADGAHIQKIPKQPIITLPSLGEGEPDRRLMCCEVWDGSTRLEGEVHDLSNFSRCFHETNMTLGKG